MAQMVENLPSKSKDLIQTLVTTTTTTNNNNNKNPKPAFPVS
jgi:hypothetical protein